MLEQYGDLLSVHELRRALNVGRNTAYNMLNRGDISAIRIGRTWKIPKEAVACYLDQWKTSDISAN